MSTPIVVPATFFGYNGPNVFSTTSAPALSARYYTNYDNNRTHWRSMHTAANTISWTNLDTVVTNAKAAGITEMTYVLYGCPTFLASTGAAQAGPYGGLGEGAYPNDLTQLTYFCQQLIARNLSTYGGFIKRIQLFNEPESNSFNGVASATNFYWGTAVQYVNMLWHAYSAIKAADPLMEVLTPGTYKMSTFVTWLDAVGDAGAAVGKHGYECFDSVALHPYHATPNGTYSGRGDFFVLNDGGVQNAANVLAARGRTGLKFHATEYGFDSANNSAVITAFLALTADQRRVYMARTLMGAIRAGLSSFAPWSFENSGNYTGQIGADPTGVDLGYNQVAAACAGKTVVKAGFYSDGREWQTYSNGTTFVV